TAPSVLHHSLLFVNKTITTKFYTLSLHDALPICRAAASDSRRPSSPSTDANAASFGWPRVSVPVLSKAIVRRPRVVSSASASLRSEEHTSELQSRENLVCRLLLEKKKRKNEGSKH